MGVKGLTKFINDRSNLYFENFKLRDCNLIVDGHSISCQLYNWKHWQFEVKCTKCYGGDYDKYAYVVEYFFNMLEEANVTPYVVFDGGFEQRKLPTILSRMQRTICTAEELNPDIERTQPYKTVFPLFLREVFKDVIRNRNIKLAMCQYEGDLEIASIAKMLNCPVLTSDSDYYLFGCQYIPFTTVDSKLTTGDNRHSGKYKYIQCKLYKLDTFLKHNGSLKEEALHLLPVLLGNDYIDEKVFIPFLQSLNIGNIPLQIKIQALLSWLKKESLETAIKKILSHFKTKESCFSILQNIEKVITGYSYVESSVLTYLNISPKINSNLNKATFMALKPIFLEFIKTSTKKDVEEEETVTVNSHLNTETTLQNPIPSVFMKNYHKCKYPSSFMDILTQNKYYCIPQVEDHQKEHSHIYSLDLLTVIHKILSNSADSEFTVIARGEATTVKWYSQEKCNLEIPKLKDFEHITLTERRDVFLKILHLENKCLSFLDNFPTEWHLFLISLKHFISKSSLTTPLIYSLVLCFITLNYVDNKIGFFRSSRKLLQRYPRPKLSTPSVDFRTNKNCFYYFPESECIICMHKVIHFFEADRKDNTKTFNRNLIHTMAQVQSVLLHIKYINSLLNYPYPNLLIYRIFDGTFLYNASKQFQEISSNLENNYFNVIFEECPTILTALKYILNIINKEFSL